MIFCKFCDSDKLVKDGKLIQVGKKIQRYKCLKCGKRTNGETLEILSF